MHQHPVARLHPAAPKQRAGRRGVADRHRDRGLHGQAIGDGGDVDRVRHRLLRHASPVQHGENPGAGGVKAIVVVTSDKCYENFDWVLGYRETDRLGGRDPYSASKGAAEIATAAYRSGFYKTPDKAAVATVRAGNVFGGGDWAKDRLIPDAMRAFGAGQMLSIRNPFAVRPWQHVFDVLMAYLELSQLLVREGHAFAEAWNIGPSIDHEVPVSAIVDSVVQLWGDGASWSKDAGEHPHESKFLRLDCSKAYARFGWRSHITLTKGLELAVEWYRAASNGSDMRALSLKQLSQFI